MTFQVTAHLWQATGFAAAAGLLTLVCRRNPAQVRYWLWLSASLKFLLPFALLIGAGSALETLLPPVPQNSPATPVIAWTTEQLGQSPASDPAPAATPAVRTDWVPSAIPAIWFSGFAAIILLRLRSWLRIRNAVRFSSPMSIPAPVPVRVSDGLIEPGVVGVRRPMLLLPKGIGERLSPSELEAVLAHELCHVRRRDNLFAAIHMAVEALFWFHPMVWWIGARLVAERERACDEEVLRLGNQPDVYADAILNVCKLYTESPLPCVSGVSGSGIKRRIEAIMANTRSHALSRAKKLLLAGAAGLALAGPVAVGLAIGVVNTPVIHAQPPAAPAADAIPAAPQASAAPKPTAQAPVEPALAFDVVSVRRCMAGDEMNGPGGRGGGGGRGPRLSQGRLRLQCLTVWNMIDQAYLEPEPLLNRSAAPLDRTWIKGGPEWIYTDWYTIDAETDNPVANQPNVRMGTDSAKIMDRMLQKVLEDRFALRIHREIEQVPMYSLTVAKGGLRLKPTEDGGCIPHEPGTPMQPSPGGTPWCMTAIRLTEPDWVIDGAGRSMTQIAQAISNAMHTHVFDKTGIDGKFTFHLQFAHDDTTPGFFPEDMKSRSSPPSDVPAGPSIFAALDGVGLKLEHVKGPSASVVVDHVERPSEN